MRNENNWFIYQRRLFPSSLPTLLAYSSNDSPRRPRWHDRAVSFYLEKLEQTPNSKAFGLVIGLVLRHCSCFINSGFSSGDQATRQ
jgi:hypothetical protein